MTAATKRSYHERAFGVNPLVAGPTGAGAHAAMSPADQLAKLGQLRDSGALATGEFEQKKKELLARM